MEQRVYFTRRHIEDAISVTKAEVSRCTSSKAGALINDLANKFCGGALHWENIIVAQTSQRRNYGKEDVCQFVNGQLCYLFTKEGDVFEAKDGDHLRLVFDETPRFELYVCDPAMTYLLCLNDHDYLIGCGRSMEFVKALEDDLR